MTKRSDHKVIKKCFKKWIKCLDKLGLANLPTNANIDKMKISKIDEKIHVLYIDYLLTTNRTVSCNIDRSYQFICALLHQERLDEIRQEIMTLKNIIVKLNFKMGRIDGIIDGIIDGVIDVSKKEKHRPMNTDDIVEDIVGNIW